MAALACPAASSASVPMIRCRVPPSSLVQTTRPLPVRAGTPGIRFSQCGSDSSRTALVAPVAGSTDRSCCRRWSRDCTRISGGPPSCQHAAARYGYAARSQPTSVRRPSSPTTASVTSAFCVPAAG